jgi:hypothetical protein
MDELSCKAIEAIAKIAATMEMRHLTDKEKLRRITMLINKSGIVEVCELAE